MQNSFSRAVSGDEIVQQYTPAMRKTSTPRTSRTAPSPAVCRLLTATDAPTSTNRNISAGVQSWSKMPERRAAVGWFRLRMPLPIAITAMRPANGRAGKAVPNQSRSRAAVKMARACTGGEIGFLRKSSSKSVPAAAPARTPRRIESGMRAKPAQETADPCARLVKVVNRTITNTSSTEAPARIICGMPCLTP